MPDHKDTGDSTDRDVVLVVEDDPDTSRTLDRCLRRLGYEVVTATDGEEGLRKAIELAPQVVLSDIRMPNMDGHTLLRRLSGHDLDTAVVIMSAHGDMNDVIDALRNGAVDYLTKPWTPSELVSAVGRAVSMHDERRARRTGVRSALVASPGLQRTVDESSSSDDEGASATGFDLVLDQLRRGEIVVPPVPAVLTELRALLARPNAGMHEITSLVERDPRLAAEVLRLTRSAHYARGARINDMRTAIGRLGLRQLQSLVQTVILRDIHQATDPGLRQDQLRIWRASIGRAVAMRALAELVGPSAKLDPETAYLAGLFADVGASFLLWLLSEREAANPAPSARKPRVLLAKLCEQHGEIGAALLQSWDLDPVATIIARTHHDSAPPAPPTGYWPLAILGAAMAEKLELASDPTSHASPTAELVDRCGAELRIGTSAVVKISESVRSEFEDVMESLTPQ
jgi:HD-like signal output (HDOD) protein/CheY-like chemotaxis protein